MKRPRGFTFMAILAFWMAFATLAFNGGFPRTSAVAMMTAILFSVSAAVLGYALWRCFSWAPLAVLINACLALINLSTFHFVFGQMNHAFWIGQVVVGGILFAWVYQYVKRNVPRVSRRTTVS